MDTDELARTIAGDDEVDPYLAQRQEEQLIEDAQETALVLPNGTVIDTTEIAQVVQAIKDLDLLKSMVAAARRKLSDLVLEERKRTGASATMHVGKATVAITVAKEIVWDMDELGKLRDAGLPEATWDELVVTTVTEKVNANVAKRIANANEAYAKIIEGARTDHEKNPSVSVS